ncbi:terpenoid cyclases/protein prenyltransferase alpha-alpha toroid [Bisporella sp. PMI_857]|nr:terpenoid cyclases/protein prenyltransferase alpha-alpha toroid [Bisporella sp. PMI_857]
MANPKLDKERHIQYWQRCLKSLLPNGYTSTDSSRMSLGFFILAALDLLCAPPIPFIERKNIRDWILKCQHPSGGFCGSPNHRYPDEYYGDESKEMDPANLPATSFALMTLSFVGRLDRVERVKCLRWLKRLQREDGSFGELVTREGVILGGGDMRYCYCAMAVRFILRGEGEVSDMEDIDVEKLVNHLRSGQTYDGGISESSQHEAHAGYAYCAIASLSLLNRIPSSSPTSNISIFLPGLTNVPATVRWLVSRQLNYVPKDEDENSEDEEDTSYDQSDMSGSVLEGGAFVGFNGRCNKRADTCYAFWVIASLAMLGHVDVVDFEPSRQFLYAQTQHQIGGFGKCPGDPPDIYHSYLGLAALAIMGDPDLKKLDPVLCVSCEQRQKIESLREEALNGR